MEENEKIKEISQIRWMNFIGLNGYLFNSIIWPLFYGKIKFLDNLFGFIVIIFGFYFLFVGSWFFFIFLITEIKFCVKKKKNFIQHVFDNKIVLFGVIPAILISSILCYKIIN